MFERCVDAEPFACPSAPWHMIPAAASGTRDPLGQDVASTGGARAVIALASRRLFCSGSPKSPANAATRHPGTPCHGCSALPQRPSGESGTGPTGHATCLRLLLGRSVDIGVAVSVEGGLIVPVIRHADTKDIEGLNREIAELAERARSGQITTPETRGATFSVTNLGAHRIDAFTPLLDLPQAAILGVGRARPRPAVMDGQVVPRTLMVLSLTVDHRVIDGDPAAAFLDYVIALLEDPGSLA
jgi:2-oxoacid dehydrogenases acyltransferase (catalytic domain)